MGNNSSVDNTQKRGTLIQDLDFIAANYITTQNFKDMERLADMDYCNNLVVMTSDIIANNLNDLNVKYLAQRLKNGVEVNEMTQTKILYAKKSDLDNSDVKNATTKRRLCIGIAKFYVKISHLFSAIVSTVNPIYIYKDTYGNTVETNLLHKKDIPKNANVNVKRMNVCSKRLDALLHNADFDKPTSEKVTINPNFCEMNYDKFRDKDKNLYQEPGIPELEKLYFDEYDYDQGGFTGMSEKMRRIYQKDVETFYKAFTGNDNMPATVDGLVKKFSDIKLRDFHKSKGCAKNGSYTISYSATLKNELFSAYADHIKTMMQTTTKNQDKLVGVLKNLFSQVVNPATGRKEIMINPQLTEESLQELIDKTRTIIVQLYIQCETDFAKGLELFQAIVEKQIMETSQEQINRLQNTLQDSIADVDTVAPERQETVVPVKQDNPSVYGGGSIINKNLNVSTGNIYNKIPLDISDSESESESVTKR